MELRVLLLVCMLSAALAGSGILSHRRRGALVGLRGGGPLDDILYGPKGKRAGDGEIGLSMTAQGAAGSEEEENDWADEDDLPKDIDMGQLMVGVGQTVVVGGEAYDKDLYELCRNSRVDTSGKPCKIDAKRATFLLNCVEGDEPTEPEARVLRYLLSDCDLAADAKTLVARYLARGQGGGLEGKKGANPMKPNRITQQARKRKNTPSEEDEEEEEEESDDGSGEDGSNSEAPRVGPRQRSAKAQRRLAEAEAGGDMEGAEAELVKLRGLVFEDADKELVVTVKRLRKSAHGGAAAEARRLFEAWRGESRRG